MRLRMTDPGDLLYRSRPLNHPVTTAQELAYLNAGNPIEVVGRNDNLFFYRLGREGRETYIVRTVEWDDGWWEHCRP